MTMPVPDMLRSLALGQALMVAPALGESYPGKTAATIAGLLLLIADEQEQAAREGPWFRSEASSLIAAARIDDMALAEDLSALLLHQQTATAPDAERALLHGIGLVHHWADGNDPALAGSCRALLSRWATARLLRPPSLPGT